MIFNVINQVWKAVERDFPVAPVNPLHNERTPNASPKVDISGLKSSSDAILTEEEEPDIPSFLYAHKEKTYQTIATQLYSQLNPSAGLMANLNNFVGVLDPMSRIDVDLKTNLNAPFRKWIEVLKIDMKKNPQNCLLDFLSESIDELLEITPENFESFQKNEIKTPKKLERSGEFVVDEKANQENNSNMSSDSNGVSSHQNSDGTNNENGEVKNDSTEPQENNEGNEVKELISNSENEIKTNNSDIDSSQDNTHNESDLNSNVHSIEINGVGIDEGGDKGVNNESGHNNAGQVTDNSNVNSSNVDNINNDLSNVSNNNNNNNNISLDLNQKEVQVQVQQLRESMDNMRRLSNFQKAVGKRMQVLISLSLPSFGETMTTLQSDRKDELLYELLEKYITSKIYRKVQVADKIADYKFFERVASLPFITATNLDVSFSIDPSLVAICGDVLTNMNFYKSPRCKLKCIAICCLHIFSYLEDCLQSRDITADDFIPVLTYVILKCEKLLLGSWGYFFSSIAMAVQYINQLNPELMSVSSDIKENNLQNDWVLSHSEIKEEKQEVNGGNSPNETDPVCIVDISLDSFHERYKFWDSGPSDIKEGDIGLLLSEYKRLAMFEYNTLKKKKDNQ